MKVRSFLRSKGRLAAPVFLFLSGMAVPVALGAARGAAPAPAQAPEAFGRIGIHRLIPNALVYERGGELLVLTYTPSPDPDRYGLVSMSGDLHARSLRVAVEEMARKDQLQSAGDGAGAGKNPTRNGPDEPGEPDEKARRSPKKQ